MSEEKDNPAQNAPKTFSEIMEQLKAVLNKAAKAVVAGTPIDPVTLQGITDLIHCAEACFAPFANTPPSKPLPRRTKRNNSLFRGNFSPSRGKFLPSVP
jgi:hypothetical protein